MRVLHSYKLILYRGRLDKSIIQRYPNEYAYATVYYTEHVCIIQPSLLSLIQSSFPLLSKEATTIWISIFIVICLLNPFPHT